MNGLLFLLGLDRPNFMFPPSFACSVSFPNTHQSVCQVGTLTGTGLLLLIFHQLDVVLGYVLVLLKQELFNFTAHVALDNDLLPSTWCLGYRRAGCELFAEILGYLFCSELVESDQP